MSVGGYATFANFGATPISKRPHVSTVAVPECKKRRLPSKHYVSCMPKMLRIKTDMGGTACAPTLPVFTKLE